MPDDIRKAGAGDSAGPQNEEQHKRPDEQEPSDSSPKEDGKGGKDGKDASSGSEGGPEKDVKGVAKGEDVKPGGPDGKDASDGKDKKGPMGKLADKAKGAVKDKANDVKEGAINKVKKVMKRIKQLIKKAIMALKMLIAIKIYMMFQMFIMMLINMLMAMVQAIVAAAVALVNAVATALGVAAAVAAVAIGGIFGLFVVAVVVVVVVVTSNENAIRSDVIPDCNTDASYMEVIDDIPVQAWTNAKLIYTFFKAYGEAAGDGHEYSDQMIAGILGNWYHESQIDPTGVETIFSEKYGIGPYKKWLQDGYVKVKYTETIEMGTPAEHGTDAEGNPIKCNGCRLYKYAGTELTPVFADGTVCELFKGEGDTYPIKYVDGGHIGAIMKVEACDKGSYHESVWSASAGEEAVGSAYGKDPGEVELGPVMFNVRLLKGVYKTNYVTKEGVSILYWSKFPAIKRLGLGLGQWTDTGIGETGEPTGRGKNLIDYAEQHGTDWYHVDLQLMYALAKDGVSHGLNHSQLHNETDETEDSGVESDDTESVHYGENFLQSWSDEAYVTEWIGGFASSCDSSNVFGPEHSWTDDNGTEHRIVTAHRVAWCAESFARYWEGCPKGHSSLKSRIQNAFIWYEIISQWNENYDYTMGTGDSLWTVAAATDGSSGSLWDMVSTSDRTRLDLEQSSRLRNCADLRFFGNSTLAEAAVSYAWAPWADDHNNGTQCWQHLYSSMEAGAPFYRSCDRTVALAVRWTGTDSEIPWGGTSRMGLYLQNRAAAYKALISTGKAVTNEDVTTEYTSLSSDIAWWEEIDIEWTGDVDEYVKQLRPGDVLIRNDDVGVRKDGFAAAGVHHVVMYVGEEAVSRKWPELVTDENGGHHGYCVVSGSIDERSPSVNVFCHADNGSNAYQSYKVYRNRGVFCSEEGKKFVNLTCVGKPNGQ